MNDAIRFLLNGQPVTVDDVPPTLSLLDWLRERRRMVGTKEGCAEGDCGACTVAVAELDHGLALRLRTLNACIQFVAALDGKAVFTVEFLRDQSHGGLHPVQRALVEQHGSQCGFCTPGFVMSLWTLYHNSDADRPPTDGALRSALSGNLCRCTGYRPIVAAGRTMFDLPHQPLELAQLRQELLALRRERSLHYAYAGAHFHRPDSLDQLLALRAAKPQATLLAGCTDIGLWVNKQFRPVHDLIHLDAVVELKTIESASEWLRIGAAVSLGDAFAALARDYPAISELWERFASEPIRNAGTLGGNVANGSPIGDSMPALIVLGARITLASQRGWRSLALEDFYLDYMKNALAADEVLVWIEIPRPAPGQVFRTYKVSKRFDSDISAVCAAYALRLNQGRVDSARIAYGGMAATPRRAPATEAALIGRDWDQFAVAAARAAIASDFSPLTDVRASADYRIKVAANLLDRLHAETRPIDPLPARATSVHAAWFEDVGEARR